MESIHEYRVEAIGAGGRNGVVHAEGILPAISFSPPPEFQGEVGRVDSRASSGRCCGQAASSAPLKAWHRPRVWNLTLCDWPRKVCSPNRIAVGALQRFDYGPPSSSGTKKIMTGPFAFLRRPRNRAWSHGPFSAESSFSEVKIEEELFALARV